MLRASVRLRSRAGVSRVALGGSGKVSRQAWDACWPLPSSLAPVPALAWAGDWNAAPPYSWPGVGILQRADAFPSASVVVVSVARVRTSTTLPRSSRARTLSWTVVPGGNPRVVTRRVTSSPSTVADGSHRASVMAPALATQVVRSQKRAAAERSEAGRAPEDCAWLAEAEGPPAGGGPEGWVCAGPVDAGRSEEHT